MKMVLTAAEIRDLAELCWYSIENTEGPSDPETEYVIEDCPVQGILDDDQKRVLRYRHLAYLEEYPDEGVVGLGPELS